MTICYQVANLPTGTFVLRPSDASKKKCTVFGVSGGSIAYI